MLELSEELGDSYQSVFLSFQEEGRCRSFIEKSQLLNWESHEIENDTPNLLAAYRELSSRIQSLRPSLLIAHGYKANFLGRIVARNNRLPIISVSHGWTGESLRVRMFELLDRIHLRWMDDVICVSAAQARKVRRWGVPNRKIHVIRDAVRSERFKSKDIHYGVKLKELFAQTPQFIVGAAGRLSPEKGYSFLVDAAAKVLKEFETAAFVLFGDGPLRSALQRQIDSYEISDRFILAGFTDELANYYPHFDVFVLPSFTEGLPNVVLEASAAGVPVVATAVGGTPEIIDHHMNGFLVPPGEADPLANRISELIQDPDKRRSMANAARQLVDREFTFLKQASEYRELFMRLGV